MSCPYQQEYDALRDRVQAVIASKWPEALDGNSYNWGRDYQPDLMAKHDTLEKEANELWVNRAKFDQFKQILTDWGRTIIELHKLYAAELRRREAA